MKRGSRGKTMLKTTGKIESSILQQYAWNPQDDSNIGSSLCVDQSQIPLSEEARVAVEELLISNLSCREIIDKKLTELDDFICYLEHQFKAKEEEIARQDIFFKVATFSSSDLYPYFQGQYRDHLCKNTVIKAIDVDDPFLELNDVHYLIAERAWSPACITTLQEIVVNQLRIRFPHLSNLSDVDFIDELESSTSTNYVDLIDWNAVSRTVNGPWSAYCCRNSWILEFDIRLKNTWTKEEAAELLSIVWHEFSNHDWPKIAARLSRPDKRRSAFQCAKQFALTDSKKHSTKLSKEESDRLMDIIDRESIGCYIPWKSVAYEFQSRTRETLYTYYRHLPRKGIRGTWTIQETNHLLDIMAEHIRKDRIDYDELERKMPTRTSVQIQRKFEKLTALKSVMKDPHKAKVVFKLWDNFKLSNVTAAEFALQEGLKLDSTIVLEKLEWYEQQFYWLIEQPASFRHMMQVIYSNELFAGACLTSGGHRIFTAPIVNIDPWVVKRPHYISALIDFAERLNADGLLSGKVIQISLANNSILTNTDFLCKCAQGSNACIGSSKLVVSSKLQRQK
ncbi:hypothetical protein ACOME3_006222 [Neoechinorhynchus agilis]